MVDREYEENQRRKRPRVEDDRACFNCAMNGHSVRDCPLQGAEGRVSFRLGMRFRHLILWS